MRISDWSSDVCSSDLWVYDPSVRTYKRDEKKAAALLEEAGWTAKGRGIRVNAKGEPLVLELMTTAGNKNREQVQQVLKSRSEERRVGKEGVSTCRLGWSPDH